jgi:acetate kinase
LIVSGLVLVINSGSSSIKYQLLDPSAHAAVASGLVEQIGEPEGRVRHKMWGRAVERRGPIPDHGEGLRVALVMFAEAGLDLDKVNIAAVGHRVVHGGRCPTNRR